MKKDSLTIILSFSLLLTAIIFFIIPIYNDIGLQSKLIESYSWCEVEKGLITLPSLCLVEFSLFSLIVAILVFLSLALFSFSLILKKEETKLNLDNNDVKAVLLWMIVSLSLPVFRNFLPNLSFALQIIFILSSVVLLYYSRSLIISLAIAVSSLFFSILLFGYLFTMMLSPIMIIMFLREKLWKNDKAWNRMLIISVPLISLLTYFSVLLYLQLHTSLSKSVFHHIFLSALTYGFPFSFVAAVILGISVMFIRIQSEYRMAVLGLIGLIYFVIMGVIALAFYLVIFSFVFAYVINWILKSEWSFRATRIMLISVLIGSMMIFSSMSLADTERNSSFNIAHLEGKLFSLGYQTPYYACNNELYPAVGYLRSTNFKVVYEVLADNNPDRFHQMMIVNNVSYVVVDRSYVVGLLGRDDTGLLFVLRVSDDFSRFYPEDGDSKLEYYYVYK